MNVKNILLFGLIGLAACSSEPKQTPAEKPAEENKMKTVFETVYVNPSPEADYPTVYGKYNLPFMERTEVVNQGEEVAEITERFMLQLITEVPTTEFVNAFKERFEQDGWEKANVNIFSGADQAILYRKGKEVEIQMIVADQESHRKVMLLFDKPTEPSLE